VFQAQLSPQVVEDLLCGLRVLVVRILVRAGTTKGFGRFLRNFESRARIFACRRLIFRRTLCGGAFGTVSRLYRSSHSNVLVPAEHRRVDEPFLFMHLAFCSPAGTLFLRLGGERLVIELFGKARPVAACRAIPQLAR